MPTYFKVKRYDDFLTMARYKDINIAKAIVDADGWGIMNSYDGNYDSERIDDETYYIMRVE